MLHKCANPDCTNSFRRLSAGKLFLVEEKRRAVEDQHQRGTWGDRVPSRIQYFWLCSECSSELTLSFNRMVGMIAVSPSKHTNPVRQEGAK